MNGFETMVNMIKNVYIEVYGVEKWESLTNQEKHDAVMFIANDLSKAIA